MNHRLDIVREYREQVLKTFSDKRYRDALDKLVALPPRLPRTTWLRQGLASVLAGTTGDEATVAIISSLTLTHAILEERKEEEKLFATAKDRKEGNDG